MAPDDFSPHACATGPLRMCEEEAASTSGDAQSVKHETYNRLSFDEKSETSESRCETTGRNPTRVAIDN